MKNFFVGLGKVVLILLAFLIVSLPLVLYLDRQILNAELQREQDAWREVHDLEKRAADCESSDPEASARLRRASEEGVERIVQNQKAARERPMFHWLIPGTR